jgi:hypothetical protein
VFSEISAVLEALVDNVCVTNESSAGEHRFSGHTEQLSVIIGFRKHDVTRWINIGMLDVG